MRPLFSPDKSFTHFYSPVNFSHDKDTLLPPVLFLSLSLAIFPSIDTTFTNYWRSHIFTWYELYYLPQPNAVWYFSSISARASVQEFFKALVGGYKSESKYRTGHYTHICKIYCHHTIYLKGQTIRKFVSTRAISLLISAIKRENANFSRLYVFIPVACFLFAFLSLNPNLAQCSRDKKSLQK